MDPPLTVRRQKQLFDYANSLIQKTSKTFIVRGTD